MDIKIYPGKEFPLGATWDGEGVNFALFAEHAATVELCLFNIEHSLAPTSYWYQRM